MPLPKPKKYERKKKFIDRCISKLADMKEFSKKQRIAVCYSQWNNKK